MTSCKWGGVILLRENIMNRTIKHQRGDTKTQTSEGSGIRNTDFGPNHWKVHADAHIRVQPTIDLSLEPERSRLPSRTRRRESSDAKWALIDNLSVLLSMSLHCRTNDSRALHALLLKQKYYWKLGRFMKCKLNMFLSKRTILIRPGQEIIWSVEVRTG